MELAVPEEAIPTLDGDSIMLDAPNVDEVNTKLDLARAYIDMGDAEGAGYILDEVLVEGDEAQKQQAQELQGQLSQ
jgi:pilus assembly protein FimV